MGLFWRSKHEVAPETGKKSLPRNLFTGQFDTKQTQSLKQHRKWPCYWQGVTHTWLKTSDNQWPYQRLRSCNFFFVSFNKISEKSVEFIIKRLKYVICKIIIIIYMKNKKERKEKTCIILLFRKKKMNLVPRNFFLGKRPGDEVAEKHQGEWVQLWTQWLQESFGWIIISYDQLMILKATIQ